MSMVGINDDMRSVGAKWHGILGYWSIEPYQLENLISLRVARAALSQGTRQAEPVALSTLTDEERREQLKKAHRMCPYATGTDSWASWMLYALAASAPALQEVECEACWRTVKDGPCPEGWCDIGKSAALQAGQGEPAMYQMRRKSRFNGQIGEWMQIGKTEFFEIQKEADSNIELRCLYAHERAAPAPEPDGAYYVPCIDCGAETLVQPGNHHPWCACGSDRFRWGEERSAAPTHERAAPAPETVIRQALIDWVAEQWHAQVANRPMVNVHRRSLDDVWRQVLRHLGVDDRARLGPTHDELRAEISTKEWNAMNASPSQPVAAEGVTDARCPDCIGSEFPGWKRGIRCKTCGGTATAPDADQG